MLGWPVWYAATTHENLDRRACELDVASVMSSGVPAPGGMEGEAVLSGTA